MGSCHSRIDENDINGNNSTKFMHDCAKKNFSKGLRYNDADFILLAFNGQIATIK
jgi:hypothetical protein